MAKSPLTQRDFRAMAIHDSFLERDDLELRGISLRGARNMVAMMAGGAEARPGTRFIEKNTAKVMFETTAPGGQYIAVLLSDTEVRLLNSSATVVFSAGSVPWSDASQCYVQEIDRGILIGHPAGFSLLRRRDLDAGPWSFSDVTSDFQAYWNFAPGVEIQPSEYGGPMTITASSAVFRPGHVGSNIRYGKIPISITGYTSPTTVTGFGFEALPPTLALTVANADGFRLGDVVTGQDSGFLGVVVSVPVGNVITVVTIENFEGPDASERLSGPQSTTTISSIATVADPAFSPLWDEQLFSAARGYPTSAEYDAGRLFLCGFPAAQNVVAASAVDDPFDFREGTSDSDAIVRAIGSENPRFRHVVSSSDLLLMSDRGIYVVELRGENPLTPATFNPFLVDARGCSAIRPARLSDGVLFVESNGRTVSAALLDGNVYLRWTVQAVSRIHTQRAKTPLMICGPSLRSIHAEKFVFIVNTDGSMGAVSWSEEGARDTIGICQWETQGSFRWAAPMFGSYWFLVERPFGSSSQVFLEELDQTALVDSMVIGNPTTAGIAAHIPGAQASVASGDRWVGNALVGGTGNLSQAGAPFADGVADSQIGLAFTAEINLWPAEVIEAPHAGLVDARVVKLAMSVQSTGEFEMYANAQSRRVGGYVVGAGLTTAPALLTRHYRMPVTGRPPHANLGARRPEPGRFRVLAVTQEVTY